MPHLEGEYYETWRIEEVHVRLNLFNHVLALFCVKFACILTIRYHVFRWESCKGCVWESVKKTQDVCKSKESCDWEVAKVTHVWSMQGAEGSRQLEHDRKKIYSLTRQLACNTNSRLIPVTRLSHQNALFGWNLTFHIPHIHYYKYPYTHEM